MRPPNIDDQVTLLRDIPELLLCRGASGVVRSKWFAPTAAYEVEFPSFGLPMGTRALLMAEQIELIERPQ